MFGFGARRRVQKDAHSIAKAMLILQEVVSASSHSNAVKQAVLRGFIIGKSSETYDEQMQSMSYPDISDLTFFVNRFKAPAGEPEIQVSAHGSERYLGLMLFGSHHGLGVTVEVSDVLISLREVGVDTLATRDALLTFPGFTSMAALRTMLG